MFILVMVSVEFILISYTLAWHTIYVRMNRWSKNGVLDRVFTALQKEGVMPRLCRPRKISKNNLNTLQATQRS